MPSRFLEFSPEFYLNVELIKRLFFVNVLKCVSFVSSLSTIILWTLLKDERGGVPAMVGSASGARSKVQPSASHAPVRRSQLITEQRKATSSELFKMYQGQSAEVRAFINIAFNFKVFQSKFVKLVSEIDFFLKKLNFSKYLSKKWKFGTVLSSLVNSIKPFSKNSNSQKGGHGIRMIYCLV